MLRQLQKTYPQSSITGGFTLIELLIVIVVVGILASVAGPSFLGFIQDNRLSKASNVYFASLVEARAAAQRSGNQVSMCKTGDIYDSEPECNLPVYSTGDVLDDENWTYGWLIYETTGPAIGYTSTLGHQLLAIVDTKVDDHVEIRASSDAANFITFGPDGRLDTGNPVVAVCDERNGGIHGYRISFSATGRAESVRFANLSSANRDCDP